MVEKAKVRTGQEASNDKLLLLKKVEIKFHEMVERRKVFKHFDPNKLTDVENSIKKKNRKFRNDNKI